MWGEDQTIRYAESLEASFERLADNPELGRSCDYIMPGLRRIEHDAHVVFYRIEPGGVAIFRILHQSILPERHPIDEDD